MNITIPTKPKPQYLKYAQVKRLCRNNGIGLRTFRAIFNEECPARKVLPGCQRGLYVRVEVLALLGLKDE